LRKFLPFLDFPEVSDNLLLDRVLPIYCWRFYLSFTLFYVLLFFVLRFFAFYAFSEHNACYQFAAAIYCSFADQAFEAYHQRFISSKVH